VKKDKSELLTLQQEVSLQIRNLSFYKNLLHMQDSLQNRQELCSKQEKLPARLFRPEDL
jgi:hypothetical protein